MKLVINMDRRFLGLGRLSVCVIIVLAILLVTGQHLFRQFFFVCCHHRGIRE